ncbi:hypothetical protein V3W47_19420 [Deinococcus sp. YIM 134068]|uniref:hypothetical protein n=1 Tax=Deinococcus lichenicola TaxID=3118910 RepID=UPI002F9251C6
MPVRKKMSDETATVRTAKGGRKVSVILPAELAEQVERLADSRGDRLTTTVVGLIEEGAKQVHEGVRADALSSLRTELLAEVERQGRKAQEEVKAQAHRLAHLLARTALESMATRVNTGYLLDAAYEDHAEALNLFNRGWSQAVEKLARPSPGVRQTLNQIAVGAGEQDPGALVDLAAATRELRKGLEVVGALAQHVQTLEKRIEAQEGQSSETQKAVGELKTTMQNLTRAVNGALTELLTAQEEARAQPKGGLFGRR